MEPKLAPVSFPTVNTGTTPAPAWPSPQSDGAQMQNDVADLRLVIEEDQTSGTFIYKTIDRRTGDVVAQLPREDVVKLRDALSYQVGSVIKTAV